jgi:hypothetical protein
MKLKLDHQCPVCKEIKPRSEFYSWQGSFNETKYSGYCKVCQSTRGKTYYAKRSRSRKYMEKRRVEQRTKRRRNGYFVIDYLRSHPCVDCGEADPVVLDFDHRDPATKLYSICHLISGCRGLDVIIAEIAKCDVRCSNCHRRKTAREQGWSRLLSDYIPPRWL